MDVVGIDYPVMDFLIHTDRLPETDGFSRILDTSWQGGGKVATALVALGRLGIETGIIGMVGNDKFGRFLLDDFNRHDVDTSRLRAYPGDETVMSVCISEKQTQGRSIMVKPGRYQELILLQADKDYITSAKYLHLTQMTPINRQAAIWAREAGIDITFDADGYSPNTEKNYQLIDIFIGSEFYYRAVFTNDDFESNCRSIMEKGPRVVIFTLGAKGCVGVYDDKYFALPAFKVNVKDTTGAGDVYHGAFIYGLLQGWDVEYSAKFASAVSAIKCTQIGGRAGIPSAAAAMKFLNDGIIDCPDMEERVEFYRTAFLNF